MKRKIEGIDELREYKHSAMMAVKKTIEATVTSDCKALLIIIPGNSLKDAKPVVFESEKNTISQLDENDDYYLLVGRRSMHEKIFKTTSFKTKDVYSSLDATENGKIELKD